MEPSRLPSPSGWAMVRIVVMSWCWSVLVDFLWIPLVARAKELSFGPSFLGVVFALNLGARAVPSIVATKWGPRSEFSMMFLALAGYMVSFLWPLESWAYCVMAFGSGLGFVRAALTLHPQMAFGEDEGSLGRAAKYSGAARNLGTITALTVPVLVYEYFGWCAACLVAMAVVVLYMSLALLQHMSAPGPTVETASLDARPSCQQGAPVADSSRSIPWIYWVLGTCFVVTELQFNMCNAAVPMTLTRLFGMPVHHAGTLMALFNGISMVILAALPDLPIPMLRQSPLNLVLSFMGIVFAWLIAVIATATPDPDMSAGLSGFALGVLLFLVSAYLGQVLLLEALTGVLELSETKTLMGIAETLGCVFAVMGGYLGERLGGFGEAAPYLLQVSVAFVALLGLTAGLGHRSSTTTAALDSLAAAGMFVCGDGCVGQSMSGLRALARTGSFIKQERQYLSLQKPQGRQSQCGLGALGTQHAAAAEPLLTGALLPA